MRMLVLGGTGFLGRHIALAAVAAGHTVTVTGRGNTGSPPPGARYVRLDRSVGLDPLPDKEFDAVVDVASMNYPWVADALATVSAGHWTFVSSVNAYADHAVRGRTESAPTLAPLTEAAVTEVRDADPDTYGGVKVACENAVLDRYGAGGLVLRAGLITGPGDRTDRFGYWPLRMASGGRVIVPDVPDQRVQHIDVRDLADWTVRMAAAGTGGVFNAVQPSVPLGEFLRTIGDQFGAALVPIAPEVLTAHGVQPWAGPKSLPLWAPAGLLGFMDLDVTAALAAGLRPRPLAETVTAALATERELGADRERSAGLTAEQESELLAAG